jgi:uncharacterized damage-inducible protein DinB
MQYYGAAELASAFKTVRENTISIAEEIPEESYSYRVAPDVRTVGHLLAHMAVNPRWAQTVHGDRITFIDFEQFRQRTAQAAAEEEQLRSKTEIVRALREGCDAFTTFLAEMTDDLLAERVGFPEPIKPSSKTRFEMLLAVKEHEMHHRGQLMLIQRLLGIVPHLTRRREAMRAASLNPQP